MQIKSESDNNIVISGISGRFPEADNIEEFWQKLINGTPLYTSDDRRWPVGLAELPLNSGKLKDISKFDSDFFNISQHDADCMDPQIRLLHEVTYEAIWDAGIIPDELKGSKTSILIGLCYDDTSKGFVEDHTKIVDYLQLSASRISYQFDFKAPTFIIDTACASSFSALHEGILLMKAGYTENILVAGVACHLTPAVTHGFVEMRMVAPDGKSKCLDADANGYCRSEAIVALFVQRKNTAKRIYANILACNTNTDGFKNEGITFPGYKPQRELLIKTIKETGIDPLEIPYIEAHVTGTAAGDPVESQAILDSYRENSTKPILVGCLKSNIGHTEGASANCSLTKVALIFQKRTIPPNLNYSNPNPNILGLFDGRFVPVLEKRPYDNDLIPADSFGFGGVNVHALLKANEKNMSIESHDILTNLSRLILISGRNDESLQTTINWIKSNDNDVTRDFLALLDNVSKVKLESGMNGRGFIIKSKKTDQYMLEKTLISKETKPLWFVFSAVGCQWKGIIRNLENFQPFMRSIQNSVKILNEENLGIDIINLLTNLDSDVYTSIYSAIMVIVTVQIALIDLLNYLKIKPDGIIGHSLGEVAAGYADGCLTAREALLTGYYIAKFSSEVQKQKCSMAAIGLSWDNALKKCPPNVYPACDNSPDGITVSGLSEDIQLFINQLHSEEIFAKEVNSCNLAYHCPLVEESFIPLRNKLRQVIKSNGNASKKWISTSIFNNPIGGFNDWPTYYANNVIKSVLFNNAVKHIPSNACIIEIGPSPILLPIIKRSVGKSCFTTSMLKRDSNDNMNNILSSVGDLYLNGHNPSIDLLYPKVEYPVARETASLSHLLKWEHSKKHFVAKFPEYFNYLKVSKKHKIDINDNEMKFLEGHCIDGRILFPATGYLYLIWRHFALEDTENSDMNKISFEFRNVKFLRATLISKNSPTFFDINICPVTGYFTIVEGGVVCATGYFHDLPEKSVEDLKDYDYSNYDFENNDKIILDSKSLYKEFRIRGYDYGNNFQGIVKASDSGSIGQIKWTGHWISLTDSMLQLTILSQMDRNLEVPTSIEYLKCNPEQLLNSVKSNGQINIEFDKICKEARSYGIYVKGLEASPVPRRLDTQNISLKARDLYSFNQYVSNISEEFNLIANNYAKICIDCIINLSKKVYEEQMITNITNFLNEYQEAISGKTNFMEILRTCLLNKFNFNEFVKVVNIDENQDLIFMKNNLLKICEQNLSIILENCVQQSFKVTEINNSKYQLKSFIENIIDKHHTINNYVSIAFPSSSPIQSSNQSSSLSQSSMHQEIPKIPTSDIIIYKDISTSFQLTGSNKSNIFNFNQFLSTLYEQLNNNGFLILIYRCKLTDIENFLYELNDLNDRPEIPSLQSIKQEIANSEFKIISEKFDQNTSIVHLLLRKVEKIIDEPIIIETTEDFQWIEKLKSELTIKNNSRIWLISDDKNKTGLIGFVRCLRKEVGGERVRCLINNDSQSSNGNIYIPDDISERDLVINVENKTFHDYGSYSYTNLNSNDSDVKSTHAFLDVKIKGDLSSLRWYEAPHKNWENLRDYEKDSNKLLCYPFYSALNFKDIMVASGRIPLKAYPPGFSKNCAIGMEFSGIDEKGNRICGIVDCGAISTSVLIPIRGGFFFNVPDNWTLEEAVTIPVVYLTVYYALIIRGQLRPNESILIHAGSGGIGQAAIRVALSMGCKVFTTIGTEEKKKFLMDMFPQLKEENFANSRDLSFEEHILKVTNGEGVDLVLNSLAEEKLRAGIDCLSKFGRFIEIGKYDIIQDTQIDGSLFDGNRTFQSVCLAHLLDDASKSKFSRAIQILDKIKYLLKKDIENGIVQPLPRTVYEREQVENAFRFMAAGKHVGKVVIKIRDESQFNCKSFNPLDMKINAIPRAYFYSRKVYIIIGGLGGFGLELAHWLVNRGARKLILTSRKGIKHIYQKYTYEFLQKKGAKVQIFEDEESNYDSINTLIEKAFEMGESIGGIFNLAMVLKDALFENQTIETFIDCCKPKANVTIYLDDICRKKNINPDHFVCFSSAASGFGNAGQTNYGYANASMESVCEKRRKDGLNGTAIQWGAIGDVGIIIDNYGTNDIVLGGTVPQRIPSCLNTLDRFLSGTSSVYSSIVFDTKKALIEDKANLVKIICHVLGVADPDNLDEKTSIGDLGMDSLMAVEIKQRFEREYGMTLSTQEIRSLTIKDLNEISAMKPISSDDSSGTNIKQSSLDAYSYLNLPKNLYEKLNDINGVPIFLVPPIEGNFSLLQPLLKSISRPVIGLNWIAEVNSLSTFEEVAQFYVNKLRQDYPQSEYDIIGYSFGASLSFEISLHLQRLYGNRIIKKLILLDGSPEKIKDLSGDIVRKININDENEAFKASLLYFVSLFYNSEIIDELKSDLINLTNRDEIINKVMKLIESNFNDKITSDLIIDAAQRYFNKIKMCFSYNPKEKFNGEIKLIRAITEDDQLINSEQLYDYGLSEITNGKIEVIGKVGDHKSFLSLNSDEIGSFIESQLYFISA